MSIVESKFLINVDKFIKHFRGIFKKSCKEKFYNKCDLEESIISEGNPASYIFVLNYRK